MNIQDFVIKQDKMSLEFCFFSDSNSKCFSTTFTRKLYANKFPLFMSYINDMFSFNDNIKLTYANILYNYFSFMKSQDYENATQCLIDGFGDLFNLVDDYISQTNLLNSYIIKLGTKYKSKKGHVVFDKEDVDEIVIASMRIRFYTILYITEDFSLPEIFHHRVFKFVISNLIDKLILQKLDKLIRAYVFTKSNTVELSDIWKFMYINRDLEPSVISLKQLDFVVNVVIPSIEKSENVNVLGYIIAFVKSSVDYMFKGEETNTLVLAISENDAQSTKNLSYYNILYITSLTEYLSPIIRTLLNEKFNNPNILKNIRLSLRFNSVIIKHISQLFFKTMFNLSNYYILPPNIVKALNLLLYHVISYIDYDLVQIHKMLFSFDRKIIIDNDVNIIYPVDFDRVNDIVNSSFKSPRLLKLYSNRLIKKFVLNALEELMGVEYYNLKTENNVKINWIKFTKEYIQFIKRLFTGEYDAKIYDLKKMMNYKPIDFVHDIENKISLERSK